MSGGRAPKAKGSAFERWLCGSLSLWISHGKATDLLWRSSVSGGRGTRRVEKHGAQTVSGDICSVGAGGHVLTDFYHIEAKHVKNMSFASFVLKGNGFLAQEWTRCGRQAKSHNKQPMMIVKQNLYPPIVVLMLDHPPPVPSPLGTGVSVQLAYHGCAIYMLEDLLATPFATPRLKMRQ